MIANPLSSAPDLVVPNPFANAGGLLQLCSREPLTITDLTDANVRARYTGAKIDGGLDRIATATYACIGRGVGSGGGSPSDP